MLDFPTSPSDGQVFGKFTWDAAQGLWRTADVLFTRWYGLGDQDAPSDGRDYVMRNTKWTLKRERKAITQPVPADFAIPSGAVMVKFRTACCSATDGQQTQLGLRCSQDGGTTYRSTSSDYGYGGCLHSTGTNAYQSMAPGSTAHAIITPSSTSGVYPTIAEGFFMLRRPGTAQVFCGASNAHSYINTAPNQFQTQQLRFWANAAAFTLNALTNLRFLVPQANAVTGAFVQVEWSY